MMNEGKNAQEMIEKLPPERQDAFRKLYHTVRENLPEGFEETFSGGMIHFVVPKSHYPAGYHVHPEEPLPFLSLASQKNHIGLYHMGIYLAPVLLSWFEKEFQKETARKPDIGKSCIRLKKMDRIPFDLIAQLCRKMTPAAYVEKYEEALGKRTGDRANE